MRLHSSIITCWIVLAATTSSHAFSSFIVKKSAFMASGYSKTTLNAIGVLARKAKEAEVRNYVEGGVEEDVLAKYEAMKNDESEYSGEPGPVQTALTKRKGTITVISEYKKVFESGTASFISEILEPKILSATFREFGANAISVLADERVGGCSYDDIKIISEEQQNSRGEVPGPIPVISSDVIVDEIQIARAAAAGAEAYFLTFSVVGAEKVKEFVKLGKAIGMETIVNVSGKEEAQNAVDMGARIICVSGADVAAKIDAVEGLIVPDDEKVCLVASVGAKDDKGLQEVEEVWQLRDKGFQSAFVSDCLYKSGNDASEHPGAIIRSMRAKSSVKWASAKARGGKGEGAKEYLGDILM